MANQNNTITAAPRMFFVRNDEKVRFALCVPHNMITGEDLPFPDGVKDDMDQFASFFPLGFSGGWTSSLVLREVRPLTSEEVIESIARVRGIERFRYGRKPTTRTLIGIAVKAGVPYPMEAGEKYLMESVSHHSGEMEIWGLLLPTGRIAVFEIYDGEWGDEKEFLGVTEDPLWYPNASAKHKEVRNADQLLAPSWEEMEFLTGRVGIPPEAFLLEREEGD